MTTTTTTRRSMRSSTVTSTAASERRLMQQKQVSVESARERESERAIDRIHDAEVLAAAHELWRQLCKEPRDQQTQRRIGDLEALIVHLVEQEKYTAEDVATIMFHQRQLEDTYRFKQQIEDLLGGKGDEDLLGKALAENENEDEDDSL
jgi:hypothetical protein